MPRSEVARPRRTLVDEETGEMMPFNGGSLEEQTVELTRRIQELSETLKSHKKDFHSRRGLLIKIGQRRRLLDYLKKKDGTRYARLIEKLGLRR